MDCNANNESPQLANAGFYFNPSPENPDNCTCFLCEKGLDGWEAGDDPLIEHLTHASHCGWAIIKAIEAEVDGYSKQDPMQPHMIDAREATFGTRWPHEGKKGWECKTQQVRLPSECGKRHDAMLILSSIVG